MIFISLLFVWTIVSVGKNNALDLIITNSFNTTIVSFANGKLLRQGGIDEAMLDRDWERYLNQLKRLKLHEMKKAIRSRVLSENIHPYTLKHIRRRLELLKLYDSRNVEVGYVKNLIQGNTIYRTVSGQGILYVKISETDERDRERERKKITFTKPIIAVVAGIYGSDWIAVNAIMHTITQLVTSYVDGKLSGFDWWIIPLLNPDGYITSMDNKLLRNYKTNINRTSGCWGVNLDRNFLLQRDTCESILYFYGYISCAEFEMFDEIFLTRGHVGKKKINCQEHPGEYPFSETESAALRDFILSQVDNCKVFVAIKEGAKALVYPFASTLSSPPGPHTVLLNLLCTEALEVFDESHTGRKELFSFGNSGSIFGPSSGYVEDWAKRHMGIPRSFAFYITNSSEEQNELTKRLDEYGKGTLELIKVLATSRQTEPYPNSFDELITNQTKIYDLWKFHDYRPIPWGRELIHVNLRDKINRGAELEMPLEFMNNEKANKYDNLNY